MAAKRPTDVNKLAASIVADAISAEEPKSDDAKLTASEIGRKGGVKGGKRRAANLSPEQRAEIARVAANARWKKSD